MGTANFQVGADANQLISASGANFLTSTYGNNRVENDATAVLATSATATAGSVVVAGARGTSTVTTKANDSAQTIAASVNKVSADTGVTATAKTTTSLKLGSTEAYSFTLVGDNTATGKEAQISFSVGAGTVRLPTMRQASTPSMRKRPKPASPPNTMHRHSSMKLTQC